MTLKLLVEIGSLEGYQIFQAELKSWVFLVGSYDATQSFPVLLPTASSNDKKTPRRLQNVGSFQPDDEVMYNLSFDSHQLGDGYPTEVISNELSLPSSSNKISVLS
jgi:hypothetical protein